MTAVPLTLNLVILPSVRLIKVVTVPGRDNEYPCSPTILTLDLVVSTSPCFTRYDARAALPVPQARAIRDVKGLLRVDKKFRTYGPEDQKLEYHKRPHIEAVYSFLKTQYSLANNKVRGLRNVASYALYSLLCLVLNREAAENINRTDKAVSPTFFNT